jgi:hypothetical protein
MKQLILAGVAVLALAASGAAVGRVSVDISIGGPDIIYPGPDSIYSGPDYYYYPPVRYVERPRVIILPERVYRPARVYRPQHFRHDFQQPRYDRQYRPAYTRDYRGHFRDGWHN